MQFLLGGLVALVALILLTGWLGRRAALEEAIFDARQRTNFYATSVIAPGMPPKLVDGQAAAVDKFDRLIRNRVAVEGLVRVKVWNADGRIIYSDEPRLIGERFDLDDQERTTLRTGGTDAELSELTGAENRFEQANQELLEVYTQVRSPEGQPLLFEAYYRYEDVTRRSAEILGGFQPIMIGSLLLFEALTVPLVWGLSRRLSRAREERERLLVRAVESSDRERRRIARDLHDGVVQELAGTSFAVSAIADQLDARSTAASALDRVAGDVRRSIRSLRSTLVEIYPPDLHTQGLRAALADLLATLSGSGVDTSLVVPPDLQPSQADSALIWRVAQEAVRNAQRHSAATTLDVKVRQGTDALEVEIADNGQGFDPAEQPSGDHVGLRLLRDLATDAGADLAVLSAPGSGTVIRLRVPR